MPYTPSTEFVFPGGAYTPSFEFVLGDSGGGLTGANCAQANLGGTGAVSQTHVLTGDGCTQINVSSTGDIDLSLHLAGNSSAQTNGCATGGIAQTHLLTGDGCTQPNLSPDAAIIYTHRFFTVGLCSGQKASTKLAVKTELRREQGRYTVNLWQSQRQAGAPLIEKTCLPRDLAAPVQVKTCFPVDNAAPLTDSFLVPSENLTQLDFQQCGLTDGATFIDSTTLSPVYGLELIFTETRHPTDDASIAVHTFLRRAYADPPNPYTPGHGFVFVANPAYSPDDPFIWPYAVQPIDLIEGSQIGGIRHSSSTSWQNATQLELKKCSIIQQASKALSGTSTPIDPPRPPPVDPPGHVTVTIPTREVYKMHHNLTVTTLNLTPINMVNVSLSYDADSFAWRFSGQLADKAQLALVQQTGNQPPVQLIVTINGIVFKVVVERIEHSRQFTGRSINLSGRGLTALLGQPYEQPASATQSSDLTVQQIADLLLPNGWTLNWADSMPIPWLVPSGAFTYTQQTPIQVLAQLSQDIGAMLVPSRDTQAITILPRYPVLPWNFNGLSPDLVVPEAAIKSVTYRTYIPSQANGVYVHGAEIGGVLGWCRLTGSDGAKLAPTVSNNLMTDVVGCRMLGERILAGQQQQPSIQSITLPMDNDAFPLAQAGQLVEITADGVPVRGIVNSITLEASLASVNQTLQLGEETANVWTAFKDLIPQAPLLVGTIAVTDGVTSLITLLDNGVVRVRGTGTVGNKVYIRAGRIEGDAPNMAQSEIVL